MKNINIIGTSNYLTVTHLCEEAQKKSKLITIIGYPGAGKTTALTDYAMNNTNVYYLTVAPSMNYRQFYSRLLNSLGVEGREVGTGLHDLINQITYKLNYDNQKKLLIIDEAGKFKPKFMEYLHELRDNTQRTTGIILAGPEYFHDNMKNWRNKGIIGIPEFYRRINHWEHLSPPTKEEILAFCKFHKVTEPEFVKNLIESCTNFAAITDRIESYKDSTQKSE